ncbi:Tyrosine recombinase XerA [uncultured archaeon]|nr:Tyrosine recombinase XerA [uncultured archaeon]
MKTMKEFLEYFPNKHTKIVRRSGLISFLEFKFGIKRKTKQHFQEGELEMFEEYLKKYMESNPNHFDDLLKFAGYLHEYPPLTVKSYISSMKEYFGRNDIFFNAYQMKDVRNKSPKGRGRTEEQDMTKEIIKKLLAYTDTRGKALFLVLISTGMRIGEALTLKVQDIDISNRIVNIRGQNTKTGESRFTFLNKEAIPALEAYLAVRQKYLTTTLKRGGVCPGANMHRTEIYKDRVFPFSEEVALQIFTSSLKKAGLNKMSSSIQRRTLHIHQFRKYFKSQLAVSCPSEIVEALMGHNGYLNGAYRRYPKDQMFEHYQKGEHCLYINEVDLDKLESKYEQKLQEEITDRRELERRFIALETSYQQLFNQKMSEHLHIGKQNPDEIAYQEQQSKGLKRGLKPAFSV